MENLVSFNITYFPAGIQNMAIVSGIPASASATEAAIKAVETGSTAPPWDNSTSVLQLLYPANSINPGNQPQGGAEFYAQPIDMASADKVALEYSVFFPADFDFVLGGKLPGIYGGHVTCSGGNNAKSCFSTRLMWRRGGVGELYLYAPKDKQTKALCSDAQSVCDATYGFSIGRGSFTWVKGGWTHIRQTVGLNTPGETDGTFALEVNGDEVINREDVFYRDVAAASKPSNGKNSNSTPTPTPTPIPPKSSPGAGGLLGPIFGGLFGSQEAEETLTDPEDSDSPLVVGAQSIMEIDDIDDGPEDSDDMETSDGIMENPPLYLHEAQEAKPGRPVGFVGLFFSTFFGGHDEKYATPRDQYVWFKDFAMAAE
ncbi:hypothetical protein ONZ45_g17099 [Pleurotus djamor]|nr:hypothetical protein ONZ45_g17099 [Pleurotus djamor]